MKTASVILSLLAVLTVTLVAPALASVHMAVVCHLPSDSNFGEDDDSGQDAIIGAENAIVYLFCMRTPDLLPSVRYHSPLQSTDHPPQLFS